MKAIVLTYDNYHPIADHMMHCYGQLWPNHPFVFQVPYQKFPKLLSEKYGDRISLIKTPPDIRGTMDKLLEGIDNDTWIYWCMDDRYPIKLDVEKLTEFYDCLSDNNSDGLSFVLSHKDNSNRYSNVFSIVKDHRGNKFYRKKHFGSIWSHQFMKAKVLSNFFKNMPINIKSAKEMDYYLLKLSVLPKDYVLLVTTQSHAQFGESSTRGMLTKNCYDSMVESKIQSPAHLEITELRMIRNIDDTIKNPLFWRVKDIVKSFLNR
jgi:hypothetical protein